MKIRTPAAILWDVDGTMVDTGELHYQAWHAVATELGRPFTRADFAATFGWRNPEIIPKLFGSHYSDAEIQALGDRKEERYRAAAKAGVALLPGVAALMQGFHAAGYRQGIGSSAPRANVDLIIELTGIRDVIGAVVAMEDTQRGKPNPQVFLLAAQRLDVAPERCLVLEDAPVGVQAAKAGGMRCIGVRPLKHHSRAALVEAGADLVVETLQEVDVAACARLLGLS